MSALVELEAALTGRESVARIDAPADTPSATPDPRAARERRLKAGDLVRTASQALGGRGGGKDDIAQGGGTDGSKADDALTSVEHAIGHVLQS